MSQVESMAKAIYDATHAGLSNCYDWDDAWEDYQEAGRERYYKEARAAIAAMTRIEDATPTSDAVNADKALEPSGTIEWGDPIPVYGKRPDWLSEGEAILAVEPYGKTNYPDGLPASNITAWPLIREIRLPVSHPHYLQLEAVAKCDGSGWVSWNPDTGEEYTPNHPVESGECVEAEHIRRSTAQEDVLWAAFQGEFERAHALSKATPAPDKALMPEATPTDEGQGVEPVAWMYHIPGGLEHGWQRYEFERRIQSYEGMSCNEEDAGMIETALYAHPTPDTGLLSELVEIVQQSLDYANMGTDQPDLVAFRARCRTALAKVKAKESDRG